MHCAPALDAAGVASAAGGGAVAWDTLFEQAQFRVDVHIVNALEGFDGFDVAHSLTFVTHGRIASADCCAFGRQFRFALQHLDDQVDYRCDLMGFRRAARHVVIHINHLIQRAQRGENLWDVDLAFGHIETGARVDLIRIVCRNGVEGRMDDLTSRTQVCQSGDTALAGARAEGNQDLRFLAQQFGDVFVLVVADAAVEERQQDRAVFHGFDIFVFGIHGHRPEDHIEVGIHIQDLFVDVEHGDLTAAAGGCPVHCKFWFLPLARHAGTSSGVFGSRFECRAVRLPPGFDRLTCPS